MAPTLFLTKLPQLNSIVIRQRGGHFFIAAQDSIVIDKEGLLRLILELGKLDFIDTMDLKTLKEQLSDYYREEILKEIGEKDEN